MIKVFFNEEGYYISGDDVNIARRCSPALTDKGDPIFQSIHHQYKVLYLALGELTDTSDDIIVYNQSRIIDELNGTIDPLDSSCKEWVDVLRRNTIPNVRGLIFFRKKNVDAEVTSGHKKMLNQIDIDEKMELAKQIEAQKQSALKARNKRIIERFKNEFRP